MIRRDGVPNIFTVRQRFKRFDGATNRGLDEVYLHFYLRSKVEWSASRTCRSLVLHSV